MHEHSNHTTPSNSRREHLDNCVGRAILLGVVLLAGLLLLAPRDGIRSSEVTAADRAPAAVVTRHPAAYPEQLGVTVAPVDAASIDALVRQHAAVREQLGITVAPVDPQQIATLIRQHQAPGDD